MGMFRQKKRNFLKNIIIVLLMIVLAFIILYNSLSFPPTAYGYTGFMLMGAILPLIYMYKDYKNPVILAEDKMTITSRGRKNTIAYKDIMYIEYRGIPHCIFGDSDSMVLHCGMTGKIFVDATYEDYLILWNQIIENAKTNNPRVTISPKMIKRLGKKNKTGDNPKPLKKSSFEKGKR